MRCLGLLFFIQVKIHFLLVKIYKPDKNDNEEKNSLLLMVLYIFLYFGHLQLQVQRLNAGWNIYVFFPFKIKIVV